MFQINHGNRFLQLLSKAFNYRMKRESVLPDSLYCKIGYYFNDEYLLQTALKHRSVTGEYGNRWESNERLEFLGDAVLGMIVTENLYKKFPTLSEGDLTRRKSYLVCRETLAKSARKLGLGQYIILSTGEENSGGRNRDSILADTFEAVIGAVYLDGGYAAANTFISIQLLQKHKSAFKKTFLNNHKSCLLEHVQGQGKKSPVYTVVHETGPDHKKIFTIEVIVEDEVLGKGSGSTKKKAEQEAARQAIEFLGLNIQF